MFSLRSSIFRFRRLFGLNVLLTSSSSSMILSGFDSCPLPRLVFPRLTYLLKNWIQSRFLITPYFDSEYSNAAFLRGAKAAIEIVSNRLADGDFNGLEGLVDFECLNGLRRDLMRLKETQKYLIPVSIGEMGCTYLYQIGIIMDDKDHRQRKVETTMVSMYYPGMERLPEDSSIRDLRQTIESDGGLLILNYRFIRDFTKGVGDQSWTINAINHFHLSSLYERRD